MASTTQVAHGLAKTAVAALLSGPAGAAQEAFNSAVDLLGGGPRTVTDKAVITDRIANGLHRLAASEGLDAEQTARGIVTATAILARFGLTAAEFASVGFDAGSATALVRSRAAETLRTLDEAEETIAMRAVADAYTSLASEAPKISALAAAYQQRVLADLTSLRQAEHARPDVHRILAATRLLVEYGRRWEQALYPASALLRAEYAVVPFWGRQDQLDDFTSWAEGPATLSTRLVTGAGGMGKTRLMMEFCFRLRRDGWRTGFVPTTARDAQADELVHLSTGVRGLLMVVDYCETRSGIVAKLVDASLGAGVRFRLILLARSASDWWLSLRQLRGRVGHYLSGPTVTTLALPPMAVDDAARHEAYEGALRAFADALGTPAPTEAVDLRKPYLERALFLHMRALAAVEGENVEDADALLDSALAREQTYWDDCAEAAGLAGLRGRPVRQAAALATLAGEISSLDEAVALFRRAPLLHDQPAAALATVAEFLHVLYPADSWLGGVQPDLLGEHLVGAAVREHPSLLAALYDA